MDALKDKKVLLGVLVAVFFAVSVILVVVLTIARRSGEEPTTWPVSGATIDDQYTIEGWSKQGFSGDEACLSLTNRGDRLPVVVKEAKAGPPDVYRQQDCDEAPAGGGRNAPLRLVQVVPCATGVVLRPGESCSLGVRLVASGTPMGDLAVTTEVTCTSREIAPCQLLKEGLNPTEQKPLALTVEQETRFPKSDSEFRITTEEAVLTAGKTVPRTEAPTTSEPATEQRTEPVTPVPETVTPAPETVTPAPETVTPAPETVTETVQPEPENPRYPDESPAPQVPAS